MLRSSRKALLVFAKAPIPGSVKTRLCPPLTPLEAARLAEAFLLDSLAQYASLGVDVRLYLSGMWSVSEDSLYGASLHVQSPGTLGKRLQNACGRTLAAGYSQVVVIGTDHPTLPTTWIVDAFDLIGAPDSAVLGPTADGGFYLIGMNTYAPAAFDGAFSHSKVFEETYGRLIKIWERVHVLPAWYDVDCAADLERLREDLSVQDGCMHTRRVLNLPTPRG